MSYVWTDQKPTKTGWYWHRENETSAPVIEKVYHYFLAPPRGGKYVLVTTSQHLVRDLDGQWSSTPIEEPQ